MEIHTIGYEGLAVQELVALLRAHGIEQLADIREAPVSRKAGFSKEALAAAVEHAGIRYAHYRALGCPKPIRDRYRHTHDFARYSQDFRHYLDGQGAALRELGKVAAAFRTCLLCYEADVNRCHRGLVAAALVGEAGAAHHI
ncbi:MAG: DUF488 domain-containing protein, partial [Proteobacteria bacterium]|nr:DUF488 domain-containing protein [Pseudomonadota bacterium]